MKILQNKEAGREDAFWYRGEIARIGSCVLIATGDIRVRFPDEDFFRKDEQAVEEAIDRGYTDKDLEKLEWGNNNWFEVIDNGDYDFGVVADTYDGALELLKSYKVSP